MKKVLSLFMVLCMVLSISSVVLADETKSTTVTVIGEGTNSYELTVPLTMTAGETKSTTLSGTWNSFTTIKVTAPNSVTLVNDSNGVEKVLGVDYSGFEVVGNDFASIEETSDITVAASDILFGTWEGIIIYNLVVEAVESGPSLVQNGTIPEGGTYYSGLGFVDDIASVYSYDTNGDVYTAGDEFPEPQLGDIYVYGDYEYCYGSNSPDTFNMEYSGYHEWNKGSNSGWGVAVLDNTKTEYGKILTEINGKAVVSLNSTFSYCRNMTGVEINVTNLTSYANCFEGTTQAITLTGTCPQLDDIAAQYDNVTVEE